MSTEFVIETQALTKRYDATHLAVDHLDLQIQPGEIYGFIGPNGAGKTTTMRMLVGLIQPTAGRVRVFSGSPTSSAILRRVGALIETPIFYPFLSARLNLTVLARYAGVPSGAVERALTLVKLRDRANDRFETFSLGMKQRLGVAAAVLKDPDLLILDEPSNGLDPPGMADMRQLIRDLRAAGKTVLFSSHQLRDIEALSDRIGVIAHGRLIAEGPVEALTGPSALVLRARPLDQVDALLRTRYPRAQVTRQAETVTVHADAVDVAALVGWLVTQGIAIECVQHERRRLEDVFPIFAAQREEGSG